MAHQQQLHQLKCDYNAWQQDRPYKTAPVPGAIKQQVIALSEHISIKEIAKVLDVPNASISQWIATYSKTANLVVQDAPTFYALPPETAPASNSPATLELSLRHPNGMLLTLNGQLSVEQLRVLAEVLRS